MHNHTSTPYRWLLFAGVILFLNLGRNDIYILDEARNAQCAREMMQRNEWVVPTFNGELRAHKPPLHYYFMRAAYTVFGVNAFAARFFSALLGLLLLVFLWWFLHNQQGAGIAGWTIAVLVSSLHFLFEFRLAVPDPYLIFFTTTGVLFFYAYIENGRRQWLWLSALLAGLGVLAKGPVAVGLPGLAIVGWLFTVGKIKKLLHWSVILYGLIIAAVAVPWFWLVHLRTAGAFTRDFFFTHNVSRFSNAMEGHGGIFLLTPLIFFAGMLPFAVFGAGAIRKQLTAPRNSLMVLCVWMVVVFIVFFSVSGTKLPNYAMPAYPFAAILLGRFLQSYTKSSRSVSAGTLFFLLAVNLLLGVGAWLGLQAEQPVQHLQWLSLVFLLPVLGLLYLLIVRKRKSRIRLLIDLTGIYLFFGLLALTVAYPVVYSRNPVTQSKTQLPEPASVYAYKIYNPAYNFYLEKPVTVKENKEWFRDSLPAQTPAYIITRKEFAADLAGLPVKQLVEWKDIFENPVTVIFQWGTGNPARPH